MHAFMRSSRVMKSEEDVPSWLTGIQEEDKQNSRQNDISVENTPLISKSTSYGGSSGDEIEVDYGDSTPAHPTHVSYGINQETGVDTSWENDDPNDGTKNNGTLFTQNDNIITTSDDRFDNGIEDVESNFSNKGNEEESSPMKGKKNTSWADEETGKETKEKISTKRNSVKALPAAKKPKRYFFHFFLILVQFSGLFGNIAMITTQVTPLIICDNLPLLQVALRAYIVFFSFWFLLGELEVSMFLKSFTSISNWISRGFLYTFIGTITMEQHKAMIADDALCASNSRVENMSPGLALLFMQISAWWIMGLGILYFLLGVTCMQKRRDRLRENYEERWEVYKEQILYGGVEGDLDSADKKLGTLKKRNARR